MGYINTINNININNDFMIVSAIVATDKENLIGIGKDMAWHLPKDFQYFKDRN